MGVMDPWEVLKKALLFVVGKIHKYTGAPRFAYNVRGLKKFFRSVLVLLSGLLVLKGQEV
jgi:hypothetical protein